jgi:hypothetical protein
MPICRDLRQPCASPVAPFAYDLFAMRTPGERVEAPGKRRCKATSKRGEPCRASVVGASGYCAVHDPERPIDMRELGHRGGKARRRGVAEQLPAAERESLREKLRDQLDHNLVKTAIERALAGGNESARVAAVKFLADLELYKADGDLDWRERMKGELAAAREQFDELVRRHVQVADQRRAKRDKALKPLIEFIAEQYAVSGLQVPFDVTADDASATLRELVDIGLIAPPDASGELVELRAKVERLEQQLARIPQAVREEFTVA